MLTKQKHINQNQLLNLNTGFIKFQGETVNIT